MGEKEKLEKKALERFILIRTRLAKQIREQEKMARICGEHTTSEIEIRKEILAYFDLDNKIDENWSTPPVCWECLRRTDSPWEEEGHTIHTRRGNRTLCGIEIEDAT